MNPDGTDPNTPPAPPAADPNTPPADLNYQNDVASKSMEEILTEKQTEQANQDPNSPPPATPPADPNQPAAPEAPVTEPTPPKPPSLPGEETKQTQEDAEALRLKLKDELKSEISEETAKKVVEFLGADPTAKDEANKPPWVKENRNPTYEEAIDWATEQAIAKAEDKITEKVAAKVKEDLTKEVEDEEKREIEAKQAAEELANKRTEQWATYWNAEFEDLESKGLIPKAVATDTRLDDKGRPLDPGKRARLEVFEAMQTASAKTPDKPLMSVKIAFYEHYQNKSKEVPGGNAPIFGTNRGVGNTGSQDFTYGEVTSTSIESILSEIQQQRSARQ